VYLVVVETEIWDGNYRIDVIWEGERVTYGLAGLGRDVLRLLPGIIISNGCGATSSKADYLND